MKTHLRENRASRSTVRKVEIMVRQKRRARVPRTNWWVARYLGWEVHHG